MADTKQTIIIASGASLSSVVSLDNQLLAIHMPSAWTAANLTFQAAPTVDGTYQDVYDDDGTEVVVTAAAGRTITIDSNAMKLAPLKFIKVRSGTTATPVNQAAARVLTIIGKA